MVQDYCDLVIVKHLRLFSPSHLLTSDVVLIQLTRQSTGTGEHRPVDSKHFSHLFIIYAIKYSYIIRQNIPTMAPL